MKKIPLWLVCFVLIGVCFDFAAPALKASGTPAVALFGWVVWWGGFVLLGVWGWLAITISLGIIQRSQEAKVTEPEEGDPGDTMDAGYDEVMP
ncbi:MAG TPA: hypothetical protein VEL76_23395 [Gemmataceae bacterium]|nr:hypothetical protein [Gemmataceae bacterium]